MAEVLKNLKIFKISSHNILKIFLKNPQLLVRIPLNYFMIFIRKTSIILGKDSVHDSIFKKPKIFGNNRFKVLEFLKSPRFDAGESLGNYSKKKKNE